MSLPTLTLYKPYVIMTLASSPGGIIGIGNTNLVFGVTVQINDLCDIISVGTYAFFDKNDATQILYGSTFYYIIEDTKLIFNEPAPM